LWRDFWVEEWNDAAVSERWKHRRMSRTKNGVFAIVLHAGEKKEKLTQTSKFIPKLTPDSERGKIFLSLQNPLTISAIRRK
jgi:hypothetical protein